MGNIVEFTGYLAPPRPAGSEAYDRIRIEEAAARTGPWGTVIQTITLPLPLDDPADPQPKSFETNQATLEVGWYRVAFLDISGDVLLFAPQRNPPAPFATVEELAQRLGRTLTAAEQSQAELLLDLATGVIAGACGKTVAWAATVNPVPPIVRGVCIELVARVLLNPAGVRSQQETLGAYAHSESYAGELMGLALTPAEERLVRRAVFGTDTGSAKTVGLPNEIYDLLYGEVS